MKVQLLHLFPVTADSEGLYSTSLVRHIWNDCTGKENKIRNLMQENTFSSVSSSHDVGYDDKLTDEGIMSRNFVAAAMYGFFFMTRRRLGALKSATHQS